MYVFFVCVLEEKVVENVFFLDFFREVFYVVRKGGKALGISKTSIYLTTFASSINHNQSSEIKHFVSFCDNYMCEF